jgi:hypothetical protein
MPLYFKQSCPVCGRRLQVHSRLLGQQIACQHCSAEFYADSGDVNSEESEFSDRLLARAEELLAMRGQICPNLDRTEMLLRSLEPVMRPPR